MRFFAIAALLLMLTAPAGVNAQDGAQSAGFRDDLRVLAQAIRTTHPAPFNVIDAASFDREVAELDARIPSLTRDRVLLEFQRIVASVGDGHTAMQLLNTHGPGAPGLFDLYPIRLYRFTDGWFVRFSDDRYAGIRGGKVVSIAGLPVETLAERLAPYVSHDNAMTVRARVAYFMESPNVLRALGLTGPDGTAPIVVQAGEKTVTASLDTARPAGELRPMRDPGVPVPLWERDADKPFWYEYDAATKVLYVAYNQVTNTPEKTTSQFFGEVFAFAREHPVERCVIDLRNNGGGNGFLNKPMTVGLIRSGLDRDGVLYAVIGRQTFSAAQMAVSDLERWTNVTFAGEPGGAKPNHFGDARPTRLPHVGAVVQIATLYWQTSTAMDRRDSVKPAIDAELSSADERAGADPVLRAIMRHVPLRTALEPAVRAADTAAATRVVRRYAGDPVYRYANVESGVNELGYEELRAKRNANALAVFGANAAVFPASANANDSLGEALAAAGRVADAVAAYRRALELTTESDKPRIRAILARLASGS
jgi:hypothetical protein